MKEFKLRIVGLFSREISTGYTILQVAKKLGKSYSFVNKEVRELLSLDVLKKQIVGNAIYCTLNLKNNRAWLYLGLFSYEKKAEKYKGEFDRVIDEVISKDVVHSIYFANDILYIICENAIRVSHFVPYDIRFLALDRKEFESHVKEFGVKDPLVLYGFEKFWEMVGDTYE